MNIPPNAQRTGDMGEVKTSNLREEFIEMCNTGGSTFMPSQVADWWLDKFESEKRRWVGEIEGIKKKIGHTLKCNMCSPKCGYNLALDTIIKLIQSK